jgi:hypothetical protein
MALLELIKTFKERRSLNRQPLKEATTALFKLEQGVFSEF